MAILFVLIGRAENGIRTRDPQLGKLFQNILYFIEIQLIVLFENFAFVNRMSTTVFFTK